MLGGFFVRANRSSSAAASDRMVILSGVVSEKLDVDFGVVAPIGVPGEPDFFWSNELKKFASTPSPPGAPTTFAPSNYEKKYI